MSVTKMVDTRIDSDAPAKEQKERKKEIATKLEAEYPYTKQVLSALKDKGVDRVYVIVGKQSIGHIMSTIELRLRMDGFAVRRQSELLFSNGKTIQIKRNNVPESYRAVNITV